MKQRGVIPTSERASRALSTEGWRRTGEGNRYGELVLNKC